MAGRNFQNSEGLSCRFGLSLYTVGARYLTSRTIECVAPAQHAGSVPLSLSLNGQQFVNIGTAYTYHDPPHVAAIVPLRGPPDGGTLAELHFASNSARATLVLLVEECESHPILSWPAQSFNFRGYLFRFAHCADSVPLPCQRVLPLPQVFNVSPQPILQDILQWSPALIFKTSFRAMHCSTTTSYPSCGYSLL